MVVQSKCKIFIVLAVGVLAVYMALIINDSIWFRRPAADALFVVCVIRPICPIGELKWGSFGRAVS